VHLRERLHEEEAEARIYIYIYIHIYIGLLTLNPGVSLYCFTNAHLRERLHEEEAEPRAPLLQRAGLGQRGRGRLGLEDESDPRQHLQRPEDGCLCLGLYKMSVKLEAGVHESTILSCPRPHA